MIWSVSSFKKNSYKSFFVENNFTVYNSQPINRISQKWLLCFKNKRQSCFSIHVSQVIFFDKTRYFGQTLQILHYIHNYSADQKKGPGRPNSAFGRYNSNTLQNMKMKCIFSHCFKNFFWLLLCSNFEVRKVMTNLKI